MNDLQCDVCDKPFAAKICRDRHRAAVHVNASPLYKCNENGCNAGFAFVRQLQEHEKSVHCNNYKCDKCGIDCKTKTTWKIHHMAVDATYDEKLAHSLPPQLDGENYLMKIYYLKHESGAYFKVGMTANPMSVRLTGLKSKGDAMLAVKFWILSEKFNDSQNTLPAEMIENDVIECLRELGFSQRRREYFIFRNIGLEEKLVQYLIETVVEQHERNKIMPHLPRAQMEYVERGEKRKYTRTENPTPEQMRAREYSKKWRENNKGIYIYFFSNGMNVGKIGETIQKPSQRASGHNSKSSQFGKFSVVWQWPLGNEYASKTKRTLLEKRILYEIGQRFELIDGMIEHFKILPSHHAEVIEIINKIINSL